MLNEVYIILRFPGKLLKAFDPADIAVPALKGFKYRLASGKASTLYTGITNIELPPSFELLALRSLGC